MPPIALYIHWPFCKSKCPYCDFNSHVRERVDYAAWEAAYLRELDYFRPALEGRSLLSIFFGGGTPSLMPPHIAERIIETVTAWCKPVEDLEITLEANPTSVEAETFSAFQHAGINRVSLGVQALAAADLRFLGREHNVEEALRAIERAARTFKRYSFDLIYARPNQTVAAWEAELQQALQLVGSHLSLYQLTIEKGTAFYAQYLNDQFRLPDEELAAALYQRTQEIMEAAGMPAYEISNHARPGEECRHNLAYWELRDYLGIGPGAHSRLHPEALMTIHHPENWLEAVTQKGHGLQQRTTLTEQERLEELLLMGLRLRQGITRQRFGEVTGKTVEECLPASALTHLQRLGLLSLTDMRMMATAQGRLILNRVVGELLV